MMPSTPVHALTYPDSAGHPRIWEHLQTLATDVERELNEAQAPGWTAYVPTWTGTTNPAIGNGTRQGWYRREPGSDLVIAQVKIVMGATTTYGTGEWKIGLPIAAHADDPLQGQGHVYDFGTFYRPFVTRKSSTSEVFLVSGSGGVGLVTNTAPHTWAVSDELYMSITYRPA